MVFILALLLSLTASSPKPSINTQPDALALRGYDAVTSFTDGQAVRGVPPFTVTWNGARWRFASAAHRDQFVKAPEQYAPQFGGYCAWTVAHNYTAAGGPEASKVVSGKLYVNYSTRAQRKWEANIQEFIRQGQSTWPGVLVT
jgi:hypothetical protein